MRQNVKHKEANRQKKSAVRTFEKKVRRAVAENNWEVADSAYSEFTSRIDKAAKTNIVHKNTASRKKSRLAHFIATARKATQPAAS